MRLQESADIGIIVPGTVVVKAGFDIELPAGEHKGIRSPTIQEPPPERLRLSREGAKLWRRSDDLDPGPPHGRRPSTRIWLRLGLRQDEGLHASAVCISQGHHAAKTIKMIVADRVAISQVYGPGCNS